MDKKDILAQLRTEAAIPGVAQTKKVQREAKKQNDKAYKDIEKEMKAYEKDSTQSGKDSIEPVMDIYADSDEDTYHQDMEILNGQEMLNYDGTPSKQFAERARMSLEGAAEMGNSPEWANVVAKGQGGDPKFGKKLVDRIKDSKKKRDDATPALDQFGDDIEEKNVGIKGTKDEIKPKLKTKKVAVETKETKKETIMETKKIKRLKFKQTIGGLEKALSIIPESYKVDNKVFEMTDGNENYRFRWEGDTEGNAVTLKAYDDTLVESDKSRMEALMGFKSDLGIPTSAQRLSENDMFLTMLGKAKELNEEKEETAEVIAEATEATPEVVTEAVEAVTEGTEAVKKKVLTEISDEKKKEHARDQHHHSDFPDGSKSNCCGASFVDGDRCSKCKEHASPAKNEGTSITEAPLAAPKGFKFEPDEHEHDPHAPEEFERDPRTHSQTMGDDRREYAQEMVKRGKWSKEQAYEYIMGA